MRQLDGTGLKRLHRAWRRRTAARLSLLLDGLGTPVNVGSIVRSAAAFGLEELWVTGSTPPLSAPGVQKTAMGTDRYLRCHRAETGIEARHAAAAAGYVVVGLELADEAVPLHELAPRLPADVCLAVGHEEHGLSKPLLVGCDHVAYLPQVGRVGSLNVAVAASIALYELRRREWASPG